MAFGFDVDRLLVWLAPREPDGDPLRAGSLCKRHADAMVVPRGWTLDDRREPRPGCSARRRAGPPRTPAAAPPPAAERRPPARAVGPGDAGQRRRRPVRTVAQVTGEPLADEDPDATVAIPWMPNFDEQDDLDGVLAAQSPLLARAFRGTDRRR